jgi:hypothetical protein
MLRSADLNPVRDEYLYLKYWCIRKRKEVTYLQESACSLGLRSLIYQGRVETDICLPQFKRMSAKLNKGISNTPVPDHNRYLTTTDTFPPPLFLRIVQKLDNQNKIATKTLISVMFKKALKQSLPTIQQMLTTFFKHSPVPWKDLRRTGSVKNGFGSGTEERNDLKVLT